jgi:hypothetical protein
VLEAGGLIGFEYLHNAGAELTSTMHFLRAFQSCVLSEVKDACSVAFLVSIGTNFMQMEEKLDQLSSAFGCGIQQVKRRDHRTCTSR